MKKVSLILILACSKIAFGTISNSNVLKEDFGITRQEDLPLEASGTRPTAILPENSAFRVWQCFVTSRVDLKIQCGKGVENPRINAAPQIDIVQGTKKMSFITRHAVGRDACETMRLEWRAITGEGAFCIGAYLVLRHSDGELGESMWLIDKVKARSKIWSWFQK